jgi:hypothetical protein
LCINPFAFENESRKNKIGEGGEGKHHDRDHPVCKGEPFAKQNNQHASQCQANEIDSVELDEPGKVLLGLKGESGIELIGQKNGANVK